MRSAGLLAQVGTAFKCARTQDWRQCRPPHGPGQATRGSCHSTCRSGCREGTVRVTVTSRDRGLLPTARDDPTGGAPAIESPLQQVPN